MRHVLSSLLVMTVLGVAPISAQNTTLRVVDEINKATTQMQLAEEAGASTYAPTLIQDAKMRLDQARSELEANREVPANRKALESAAAADAAQAKSKWLGAVEEIKALRASLESMGAKLEAVELAREEPVVLGNASSSRERVALAREVLASAMEMRPTGKEGEELERADTLLESAEKIVEKTKDNAVADHLAYVSSMSARKAVYVTKLRELSGMLSDLRLKRTELAQAEAARQAEEARLEREKAEKELEAMRQKLEEERSQRAAEQAEITRLREDLKQQQEELAKELASARAARLDAEQRLDYLRAQYESALRSTASDAGTIETLRQKVEDQEFKLKQIRDSEQESEQTLLREIDALRADLEEEREKGRIPEEEIQRQEEELASRESEIEQLRKERNQNLEQRREAEAQFRERIARAEEQTRMMAEQSAELEKRLEEERKAREKAEQELARMKAEIEQRQKLEQQHAEEMAAMKKQLAELAETRSDARGFIVTLPGVYFDSGKATLKEGTKANLTKIAQLLQKMEQVRIVVEGHTDSVGSAELNQKLSEARADSVRDYLVAEGMDRSNITTVGRGESQPVASNDTNEGRSQNRRVEIVIEETE